MKFKDKYFDDFDAVLLSKGERQKPQKEWIEYGKIPGISQVLYQDTGTRLPYERQIQILSKDITQLPDMYWWLDGSGQLYIDEGGYYNARVLSVESQTKSFNMGWTMLTITFEIQPYLYLESQTIELTNGGSVWNPGIISNPYFQIYGSGDFTLTVNGVNYQFDNVTGGFIEFEFPYAWNGVLNKGKSLLTGFPKLQSGNNVISWTYVSGEGLVGTVLMNGRWRTL